MQEILNLIDEYVEAHATCGSRLYNSKTEELYKDIESFFRFEEAQVNGLLAHVKILQRGIDDLVKVCNEIEGFPKKELMNARKLLPAKYEMSLNK